MCKTTNIILSYRLYVFLIGLALTVSTACSTVEVTRIAPNVDKAYSLDTLYLLTANEINLNSASLRAKVDVKYQAMDGWLGLRKKLFEKAQAENANILLVDTLKIGDALILKGSFYQLPEFKPIESNDCGFILYRTGESILGRSFDIRISVENNEKLLLKVKDFYTFNNGTCNDYTTLKINNRPFRFKIENPMPIYMIYKETYGSSNGMSISIGIGGVGILKIVEQEPYMLEYKLHKLKKSH